MSGDLGSCFAPCSLSSFNRVCVNLVDVLAVMLNVFSFCIRLGQESD